MKKKRPLWPWWVAVVLGLLALSVNIDIGSNSTFWFKLFDAGHFPFFAGVTLLLYFSPTFDRVRRWVALAWTTVLAAVIALLVEWIQPYLGRTASREDFVNGILGILVAAVGVALWRVRIAWPWRMGHALVSLGILIVLLRPAFWEMASITWRSSAFPLLADFEDPIERRLWYGDRTRLLTVRAPGDQPGLALRIETQGGAWPGARYQAGDLDWRHRSELVFRVFNEGQPFTLYLRIDDDEDCSTFEKRYNGSIPLDPGWNDVRIPLETIKQGPAHRTLNMSSIRNLYFFADRNDSPPPFVLDRIRLE